MLGIVGASSYFIAAILTTIIAKSKYVKFANGIDNSKNNVSKLSVAWVMIFALFFTLSNVFITNISNGYGNDRTNYYIDFYGRKVAWQGVDFLLRFIHGFSDDFNVFLYFCTFVCFMIVFAAYRISDDATPDCLIFVLSTSMFMSTLNHLKQCWVNALAMVFFALLLSQKSLTRDILCIAISLIAGYFHATGFILLPIYLIFRILENNRKSIKWIIIPIIIFYIYFKPILLFVAEMAQSPAPLLSQKILEYFAEDTYHVDEGSALAVFKGLPYYILVLWGYIRRKKLSSIYKNYDKVLILSLLGIVFFLFSANSYWMGRFTVVFAFPMGILYSMIISNSIENNKWILKISILGGSFFFSLRTIVLMFINYGGV